MSLEVSINDGLHKLPKNCYPPTDSEEEESFVVLPDPNVSLSTYELQSHIYNEPFSHDIIDRSINVVNDLVNSIQKSPTGDVTSEVEINVPNKSLVQESVESDCKIVTNGQELNLTQIQNQILHLTEENSQLKDKLQQNNIAMRSQYDIIKKWQDDADMVTEKNMKKFQEVALRNSTLLEENETLRSKLTVLNNTITKLSGEISTLRVMDQKKKEAIDKISFANMNSFELVSAERKIKTLDESLAEMSQELITLKKETIEKENKFDNQKEKYLEEIARLKEAITNFDQKNVKTLEEEKVTMTKQMSSLQVKIIEMSKELKDHSSENAALKAQLQVYKDDFDMERQSRSALKEKEDQLTHDLNYVQKQYRELLTENGKLKLKCGIKTTTTTPIATSTSGEVHNCPWCNCGYLNIEALNCHVNRCSHAVPED